MPEPAWNYSLIQRPANEDLIKDNQGNLTLKTDSGDYITMFCLGGLGAVTCPKKTIEAEPRDAGKGTKSKLIHKCCPEGEVFTDPTLRDCGSPDQTTDFDIRSGWSMPVNGFLVDGHSAVYNETYAYRGKNTGNKCHCSKMTPILSYQFDNFMIGADGRISSVKGWDRQKVENIGEDFCVEMTTIGKEWEGMGFGKPKHKRVAFICDRHPNDPHTHSKATGINHSFGFIMVMAIVMKML